VPLDDVVEQLSVPEPEKPNVRELLGALGRLPFNQRAAITMRELEGRTYDEIAETLDVTVPAVEALLVRARRTLRLQSSALRGLAVVGLPRSLRGMFETGDVATAGGALLGGGVLAKAAAVVLAGVVAGGVGKAVDAGVVHRSHNTPRLEPHTHAEPATASHGVPGHPQLAVRPHTAAAGIRHRRHATAPVPAPIVSVVSPGEATAPPTAGGPPGGSEPPVDGGQPVLPPAPPPAVEPTPDPRGVEPPPAVLPVVPIPPLPQPPALPPVPALPSLPPVLGPPPVELPVAPPAVTPPVVPTVPALPFP
jgi:hypothetical protein